MSTAVSRCAAKIFACIYCEQGRKDCFCDLYGLCVELARPTAFLSESFDPGSKAASGRSFEDGTLGKPGTVLQLPRLMDPSYHHLLHEFPALKAPLKVALNRKLAVTRRLTLKSLSLGVKKIVMKPRSL